MTAFRPISGCIVILLTLLLSGYVWSADDADQGDSTVGAPSSKGGGRVERPVAAIEHAIIISCDGMRPDVLLRSNAPHIRHMMDNGAFTMWARTTKVAITLPSHTSMLTGVTPDRHGINWNDNDPGAGYPKVPTIFELAKKAKLSTALVAGKTKFATLAKPGTVDWASIAAANDADVGKRAIETLTEHKPDLLFVHFPGADAAGHSKGWGGKEQIAAIAGIDEQIGKLFDALDSLKRTDSTVVLLSADHGGAGITHGGEDARSKHIPWIVTGPGIRKNVDLTSNMLLAVNTEDTFSTICFLLGLKPTIKTDGKPIQDILEDRELLKESKTP